MREIEKLHLCRTCRFPFAECQSDPTFASETDDRVVRCNTYKQVFPLGEYKNMTPEQLRAVYNWRIVRGVLDGREEIVDADADAIFVLLCAAVVKGANQMDATAPAH